MENREKFSFLASGKDIVVSNQLLEEELKRSENICWNRVLLKDITNEVYLENVGNMDIAIKDVDLSGRDPIEIELLLREIGFIEDTKNAEAKVISLQNAIPDFNEDRIRAFIELIPTLNHIDNFKWGVVQMVVSMVYNSQYGLSLLDFPSIFMKDYDPRNTLDEESTVKLSRDLIVIMHVLLAPEGLENKRVKLGLRDAIISTKQMGIDIELLLRVTEKLTKNDNVVFKEILKES